MYWLAAIVIIHKIPANPTRNTRWYDVGPYFAFRWSRQSHTCHTRRNPEISMMITPSIGRNESTISFVPEAVKTAGKESKVT